MNFSEIKSALKNLFGKGNTSVINILGLAIAFVSVFYIYSYISFELSYDAYHKNTGRIYRISGDILAVENTATHAVLGPLMGPGLKDYFPAVESFTRLIPIHKQAVLEFDQRQYTIKEAYMADHNVVDIFTLEFIYGSKSTALLNPDELIINRSLSEKIFGDRNPVGETVIRGGQLLKIIGVVKDSPENSHHKLNVLFSIGNMWSNMEGISTVQISEGYWMPTAFHFIMLKPNSYIKSITDNFDGFYDKYMAEFGNRINATFNPIAIPLKSLHFSPYMNYDYPKGNKTYIYLLLMIGGFILTVAIINYSNLLIAQNINQSKNIGVKKILGVSSFALYRQYLANSFIFLLMAMLVAFLVFYLTLSVLTSVTNINQSIFQFRTILMLSVILLSALVIITSLIAFLNQSGKRGLNLIQPQACKTGKSGSRKFGFASTVLQFSLSIILLIAMLTVSRQINFFLKKDMGFDKENVVVIDLKNLPEAGQNIEPFYNEIISIPEITNVSVSTNIPGDIMGTSHFQIARNGKTVTKIVNVMGVDYNYIQLMGMTLKEGRNFSETFNDENYNSVIVNEGLINFCGLTGNIVGQKLGNSTIVGVLKDACFNSLHNHTEPLLFYLGNEGMNCLNVKLDSKSVKNSTELLAGSWEKIYPGVTYEMKFLDDRIAMLYNDDQQKNTLIKLFTFISLFISVMGILNLSAILINGRIKEIGIRKVNGAKPFEILSMLNIDFAKWTFIAFIIASPIAYFLMFKWLNNFANKINLSWWVFALAGLLAVGITLITVSFQAWKTATRNPVKALRYE